MNIRPIDVLNNLKNHTLWPQSYHLSKDEADCCIDALQHTWRWIPIEERLPKVGEDGCSDYILLSFDNYGLPAIGRYEFDEENGGAFYEGDEERSCSSYGLFVNAWMPLPERWKEEG